MAADDSHQVPLLEVQGLSKAFGGLRAVDRANFTVRERSITGLIGPNGAGKTTAFNLVSGVLRPDQGEVRLAGRVISGLVPHRIAAQGVSRTFQITRALSGMTVLENVVAAAPPRTLWGLARPRVSAEERVRAMELLEFVGIDRLAGADAGDLSYGQRKLLEFASAMMPRPSLVLLDEPAGGVNPTLLERIIEHVRELRDQGTTFLIVEHNMDMVMRLCDSVVVMAHGTVMRQADPATIQADPVVLDAYLGRV